MGEGAVSSQAEHHPFATCLPQSLQNLVTDFSHLQNISAHISNVLVFVYFFSSFMAEISIGSLSLVVYSQNYHLANDKFNASVSPTTLIIKMFIWPFK